MAMVHHHPVLPHEDQKRCATMFCLTWVGFFIVIGALAWIGSSL